MKTLRPAVRNYLESCPRFNSQGFDTLFPDDMFPPNSDIHVDLCAAQARDLLSRILIIDPRDRITIDEALRHAYITMWLDEGELNAVRSLLSVSLVSLLDHVSLILFIAGSWSI